MKIITMILLAGATVASFAGSKGKFTIQGVVKGADAGMIYLQKYKADRLSNVDSAKLSKGKFAFSGTIAMPEMWHITMAEKQIDLPVFIENSTIEVTIYADSLDKSIVKGSATQDIYQQYVAMDDVLSNRMEQVNQDWKAARNGHDTAAMKRIDLISTELEMETKRQLVDFVKSNRKTVVSPYLVMKNSWQFELADLEEIATALDTSLAGSQYVDALKKRVAILQRVAIGQIAPDFTMNDSKGKPVTLSSFKGKILLVDFWASWCGPCRAENPNVVEAYQAFNKKGFDVLGCSFDRNREKWLQAVADDKLTWTQVSDLLSWGNAAGKLYGVNSIPANVLLDKDQKIIGRNLRGEDLMNKLVEVLGPAAVEPEGKKK